MMTMTMSRIPVHRMELRRIQFMINSYLRIRLEKIQRNVHTVTAASPDNPDRWENFLKIKL